MAEDGKIKCLDGTVWRWQQGNEWSAMESLKEKTECIDNRGVVTDAVSSIAFSPDGQTLATGSLDNDVRLWQLSDRTRKRTLEGHTNSVLSVAFNTNGQMLASGSWDNTVRLWRVSDGTLLNSLEGHTGSVKSVALSPNGQILASGSSDNTVRLWQVSNGQLLRTLTEHTGSVFSVAFSPDGQTLASGALDGTVRLWQLENGALLRTLAGHTNTVYGVAFRPDGKMLVSGSRDGTVRLWGVSSFGTPSPEEAVTLIKQDVIKIGAAVSETGRYAREGKDVRQGYDLWADWVNNERGGIQVGDKRYNVEMIYYDDESHPDIAAKLVQTLIAEDEVNFLLGPYSSGLTGSTSAISEKYDVIMVEGNGSSESLFERGFENLFAVLTPASQYTKSALELLAQEGAKSVVIAYKEETFSKSTAEGAQRWAEQYGLEVLDFRSFPESEDEGKRRVEEIITQFGELEPDVFVAVGHYKEALLFTKTAKDLDFNPKAMVMPVGPSNPQFIEDIEDIGADANYIISPTQWEQNMLWQGNYNSPIGTAAKYAEDYKKMWHESPTYQAAESTAAALALMVAIENAGSFTTADVRAALNELDIETFYGPINFDETGKNTSKPMGIIQIQEEKIKVIGSSEDTNLIYPAPPWSER
jgi:branched-chain amino acid transport system substrate-binding protein